MPRVIVKFQPRAAFSLPHPVGRRYSCAHMGNTSAAVDVRSETPRDFESAADTIMYRWSVERDPWVSTREVDQARAYLARAGVDVSRLPRLSVGPGETLNTLEQARVVLMGLRHLHAARRRARD
jgi:hypothetical protein